MSLGKALYAMAYLGAEKPRGLDLDFYRDPRRAASIASRPADPPAARLGAGPPGHRETDRQLSLFGDDA